MFWDLPKQVTRKCFLKRSKLSKNGHGEIWDRFKYILNMIQIYFSGLAKLENHFFQDIFFQDINLDLFFLFYILKQFPAILKNP